MTANTFGPYRIGKKDYELAALTLGRYQHFLVVFTKLPISALYDAWAKLQASIAPPPNAKPGEYEVSIPPDIAQELADSVITMVLAADENNVLVKLVAVGLDVSEDIAKGIHYKVGLQLINDFFTANPSLLLDSIQFLTGIVAPKSGLGTDQSRQTLTDSPPKPAKGQAAKKKLTKK